MIFKVYPHKIEIVSKNIINEKEVNISDCEFIFDSEIPNDYIKEAYFTIRGNTFVEKIENNKCRIPDEVLVKKGTIEIGVVAYDIEDNTYVKRFNPTPVYITSTYGSLKDEVNDGVNLPPSSRDYIVKLLEGVENIDLDATKVDHTTTITIEKKDGTVKTVDVYDGINGTNGTDGVDGYSPNASVSKSGNTATITITDKTGTTTTTISDGINGTNGADGYTPQRSVDYWTSDDIATIQAYIDSKTIGLLTSNY